MSTARHTGRRILRQADLNKERMEINGKDATKCRIFFGLKSSKQYFKQQKKCHIRLKNNDTNCFIMLKKIYRCDNISGTGTVSVI